MTSRDAARPALLWFRNDLRLADHAALNGAIKRGAPVIPIFILDDESPGSWAHASASRWWLAQSLRALSAALEKAGSQLILRQGESTKVLAELADETGAGAICFSRCYEPWAAGLEQRLKDAFADKDIILKRYAGALLKEPEDVRNLAGEPYKVYSPFWRALSKDFTPGALLPAPETIPSPTHWPKSDALSSWSLEPSKPDWAGGMRAEWQPGESGANARLDRFLKHALKTYAEDRNRPDIDGTSKLSPHLHFGEISPRTCWVRAGAASARDPKHDKGLETFLKELVWREFSYSLLHHWPTLPEEPFRPEFAAFPWAKRDAHLKAWQRGLTGYPIVDAGMRELWTTGYMHNRVRMIVASFLIKDLLIPWQDGEAWFWDTLVDADLANNAASWQWVAGSGADAAPYFRVFNPVTQGQKFDPDGKYVRRWIPEIAKLPDAVIHEPWAAPAEHLTAAGVSLGTTYPLPVVDHAKAREFALAAFEQIKKTA